MTTKAPAACALALLAQLSHVVITHSVEWTTAAEARTAMEVRVTTTRNTFSPIIFQRDLCVLTTTVAHARLAENGEESRIQAADELPEYCKQQRNVLRRRLFQQPVRPRPPGPGAHIPARGIVRHS